MRPFQTVQADVPDQLLSTIDGSRAFQTVQSAPKLVYAALLIRIGAVGNKIWITQLHPLLRLALFWGVYPGPCGPCTSPSWLLPHRGSVSTVVFDTQLFFPITHFLTHLLSVWRRLLLKPSGQPQKLFRQLFWEISVRKKITSLIISRTFWGKADSLVAFAPLLFRHYSRLWLTEQFTQLFPCYPPPLDLGPPDMLQFRKRRSH